MYSGASTDFQPDAMFIIMSIVAGLISFGVIIWLIVFACLNGKSYAKHWKAGLFYGLLSVVLVLPLGLIQLAYFDPSHGIGDEKLFLFIMQIASVVIGTIFMLGWCFLGIVVTGGEWQKRFTTWSIWTMGPVGSQKRGIVVGLIAAVAFTVFTELLMLVFPLRTNPMLLAMMANYPELDTLTLWVLLPATMFWAAGIALYEEILYRGALLGPMVGRWSKRINPQWWIMLVAILFALIHLLNATDPVVKVGQIWVLGVVTGVLMLRYGLLSAIVCHAGFNMLIVLTLGLTGRLDM